MREIVLDTETTGLDPNSGHRIVEIGCIELHHRLPTGESWHRYVNPERDMPDGAFQVHGLSEDFLSTHPVFAEIAGDFLDFIADSKLVIHNAGFDMGFLNAELTKLGFPPLAMSRGIDTLRMARSRYPGAQASLDALCRRFGIDNSARGKHGALLDAELLAKVYLELSGGRQPDFELTGTQAAHPETAAAVDTPGRAPRPHAPNEEEAAAHAAFVDRLDNPIWRT
jgi:DNA polymerase-3 subunit epsilon